MMMNYNPWNQYGIEPEVPHDDIDESMTPEERLHAGLLKAIIQIAMLIVAILIGIGVCALLGSCTTTKYVPVVEHRTDTVWQNHTAHDSIYIRDSVYLHEYTRGDTVYIERVKWKTMWQNHIEHDTIYKSRTDSIPYPVEVIKEVPAELSWWQQTRIHIGGVVFWLLLFAAAWYIGGKLKKVKDKILP